MGWIVVIGCGIISVIGAWVASTGKEREKWASMLKYATPSVGVNEALAKIKTNSQSTCFLQVRGVVSCENPLDCCIMSGPSVVCEKRQYRVKTNSQNEVINVCTFEARDEIPFFLEDVRAATKSNGSNEPHGIRVYPQWCTVHTPPKTSPLVPKEAGVWNRLAEMIFTGETEVGEVSEETAVTTGSIVYVLGEGAIEDGQAVLRRPIDERLPFAVKSEHAQGGFFDSTIATARSHRFYGIQLCALGVFLALLEQIVPSNYRSTRVGNCKVVEKINRYDEYILSEFWVTPVGFGRIEVDEALELLRRMGKVQLNDVPAEVTEDNGQVRFKFFEWTYLTESDRVTRIIMKSIGWIGVAMAAVSLIDALFLDRFLPLPQKETHQ